MGNATPYRLSLATDELLEAARALEARGRHDADSFDRYESSSLFVVVTDGAGELAGAARLILPGAAGLKTVADVRRASLRSGHALTARIDPARTWDVASIAVRPESAAVVTPALCYGVVQALRVNRVRFVVASLDERSRMLLSCIGLVPAPILGRGTRIPVWGRVSELLDVQRRVNPDGYRLVVQGVGLNEVVLPEQEGLRVTARLRAELAAAAVRELAPTA